MASLSATAASKPVTGEASSNNLHLHSIRLIEPLPRSALEAELQLTVAFTPLVPLIDCRWRVTVCPIHIFVSATWR